MKHKKKLIIMSCIFLHISMLKICHASYVKTDIKYFYQDIQSNVVGVINYSGSWINFYQYSPYGMQNESLHAKDSRPSNNNKDHIEGVSNNSFGYTGQLEDKALKMLELGNGYRAYNPAIGNFMHRDSFTAFSNKETYNHFNYASGNPINYNDPSGHFNIHSPWKMTIFAGNVLGVLVAPFAGNMLMFLGSSYGLVDQLTASKIDQVKNKSNSKILEWSMASIAYGVVYVENRATYKVLSEVFDDSSNMLSSEGIETQENSIIYPQGKGQGYNNWFGEQRQLTRQAVNHLSWRTPLIWMVFEKRVNNGINDGQEFEEDVLAPHRHQKNNHMNAASSRRFKIRHPQNLDLSKEILM